MFVYSVKSKQIKFILLVAFVIMTGISLFILSNESQQTGSTKGLSYIGETHGQRMEFISQFCWEVDENPIEIKEVIIPTEFDDIYKSHRMNFYNSISDSTLLRNINKGYFVYLKQHLSTSWLQYTDLMKYFIEKEFTTNVYEYIGKV